MDLAAVSAHAAGSIEEFMKLAGSAGVNTAVWIRLKNPEQSNPETEAVGYRAYAAVSAGISASVRRCKVSAAPPPKSCRPAP